MAKVIFFLSFLTVSLAYQCGVQDPTTRIIGGSVTNKNKYPWMVLLNIDFLQPNGSKVGEKCGATIISDQWAVTAAHCLHSKKSPGSKLVRVYLAARKQHLNQHDNDEIDMKGMQVS